MSATYLCMFSLAANCGSPPERDGVEFTITDSVLGIDAVGGLVVNLGTVATYSCVMEGYIIEDTNALTCVSENDTAQWYPAEAPVCEQG